MAKFYIQEHKLNKSPSSLLPLLPMPLVHVKPCEEPQKFVIAVSMLFKKKKNISSGIHQMHNQNFFLVLCLYRST